jgi:ATP adenylyltransferase
MTELTCKYCVEPGHPERHAFAFVTRLRVSDVFLFPDQTLRGRCIVVFKEHAVELFHLNDDDRNAFMADVADVASVIASMTGCDKVNYAAYGDVATHLHFHIVPKWKGKLGWADAFILNPPVSHVLSDADQRALTVELDARLAQRVSRHQPL